MIVSSRSCCRRRCWSGCAEDHLAWTILGVVDELDLSPIYGAYRPDGHGRPAYEPRMIVALLLYGYAKGIQSSREIERRCR